MSQILLKDFIAGNEHAFPVEQVPVFCIVSVVNDVENYKNRFTDVYDNIFEFVDGLSGYYETDFLEYSCEHEDRTISFIVIDERHEHCCRTYYEIVFYDDFYYVYQFDAISAVK